MMIALNYIKLFSGLRKAGSMAAATQLTSESLVLICLHVESEISSSLDLQGSQRNLVLWPVQLSKNQRGDAQWFFTASGLFEMMMIQQPLGKLC